MKKFNSLILSVMLLGGITGVVSGCKTSTPAVIAYKSLGATITAVDVAMKTWASTYNARTRAAKTDEDKTKLNNEFALVSVAKDKYNAAMTLAFGAIETAYKIDPNSITPPEVSFAAQNLLTILNK